jgi:hypothetical protein
MTLWLNRWWHSLTEAFRERRRKLLHPDGEEPKWTYDVYPDRRSKSEFRLFWHARGPGGRFIVEEVDLLGDDFDQTPRTLLEPEACAAFVGQVLAANIRIKKRRDRLRAAHLRRNVK